MQKTIHKSLPPFIVLILAAGLMFISSCSKDPGEGGSSTITGKVLVHHYNYDFTVLLDEYWAPDEDVFIIYGDGTTSDDRVRSGPEGDFRFQYLRKGKYQVYVYSDDSSFTQASGKLAITRSVEITKNNQTVDAGTIVICKN